MSFDPAKHLFVFTHIPKCGGTSVHKCFEEMLPDKYVVVSPHTPIASINSEIWGLGGHFNYGGVPKALLGERTPIYTTIVRHPIERFISFYKHVAAREAHYAHRAVENFLDKEPLEVLLEWEALGFREIANLATQMITNKKPEEATANKAIQIIDDCYRFITTAERIDGMLGEIAEFIGVAKPELPKLNTALSRPIDKLRSPELVEELLRLNQKDLIVYREVAKRTEGSRKLAS